MNVNSAKEFRNWFKVKEQEDRPEVDENFMGCSYDTKSGKKIKGFFYLFHGKKDDIERYLPSLLDIAEDNQAIYEFLQNAVDCGATHFWVFYNDKYFLAVNNGLSERIGSEETTSTPAAYILPQFNASAKSCSAISPPRLLFRRITPSFILEMVTLLIISFVSGNSGQ